MVVHRRSLYYPAISAVAFSVVAVNLMPVTVPGETPSDFVTTVPGVHANQLAVPASIEVLLETVHSISADPVANGIAATVIGPDIPILTIVGVPGIAVITFLYILLLFLFLLLG